MSISRQTLSVVIVTFKSDQVIDKCIQSIPDQIQIIVVDNSNDKKFKENIEKKYKNVECILSSKNIGMGSGNNLGLKHVKTDYAIVLNPDVIFEDDSFQHMINESKNLESFSILAPISKDLNYPNYKINNNDSIKFNENSPFKVSSVDGYAMLLNLKRLNQLSNFKNFNFFDENFFMYLENDDLCKRVIESKENIFIIPKSKIKHLGATATNQEYSHQVELSRNWHWIWSKFYFNKKHYGFVIALLKGFPSFFSAFLKFLFFLFLKKKEKKQIYLQRVLGFTNALIGKKSFYRPKIDD